MKTDVTASLDPTMGSKSGGAGVEYPWVLMRVGAEMYALCTTQVREMISTPDVTEVPYAPPFVRGLINLRGQVLPLVDLRTRFGLPSFAEETEALVTLLGEREKDHRNWLTELDASVRERRQFKLTTDPHACAFGRWYDTFKTDNLMLETVLKRFDEPHRRVHALGKQVVDLMAAGKGEEAEALVARAESTVMADLMRLFGEAVTVLRSMKREIAVIVAAGARSFAVAVDSIESVERLNRDQFSPIEEVLGVDSQQFVSAVGRRAKDNSMVMTLRPEELLGQAEFQVA